MPWRAHPKASVASSSTLGSGLTWHPDPSYGKPHADSMCLEQARAFARLLPDFWAFSAPLQTRSSTRAGSGTKQQKKRRMARWAHYDMLGNDSCLSATCYLSISGWNGLFCCVGLKCLLLRGGCNSCTNEAASTCPASPPQSHHRPSCCWREWQAGPAARSPAKCTQRLRQPGNRAQPMSAPQNQGPPSCLPGLETTRSRLCSGSFQCLIDDNVGALVQNRMPDSS